MERSQENSVLLSTKVKCLEANAVTNPRQFAHEAVATKAFRRQIKTLPSQANAENISNIATFSSAEGLLGRNSEQLISSLQTQYFPPTVPGTGLPMSLPYVGGMIAAPGMDPRTLNAGNLLYTYGAPVMSFPNFSGGYGHVQRGKAPDEAAATADKNMNSSASSRSMEKVSWCPKEPVRTESVIKTVMDRQESTKKSSDTDKRNISDSGQGLNAPVRYSDKERDVAKLDDRKSKAILRDEQSETNLSRREKQSVVDVDQSRDKTPKAKTFEHLSVDALASKRPNNGPTSRTNENGNLTYSSLSKSYTASEARSSPYLNEPPTLYPYHNALPARSSPNTTNSNVPSSMPKLTPIAPRLNNGSPLTLPHSSEAERRNSSPSGAWRQSYSYTPNSHSSGLSAQGHVRWKGNYFDRPPPVDKTDEVSAWRNKQLSSEDREIDRTASYEHAQNLPDTRRYHPSQSWERPPSFGALRQQVRVADADKPISGKDIRNDSREMLREPIRSSEQIPTTVGKDAFKFGVGPVGFRKETDVASSKLPANLNQEEYQRNQNVASKSIVGEYVRYNTSDDAKGSLGNVIIHGKAGSYKVSVERREDKPKYLDCIANGRQTVEAVKHTRPEDKDRSFPGNYNDYDAREPKDSSYMAASRAEFKTVKDIKDKECTDRSRTFDSARYKEQISRKEYAGRKPDSRELTAMIEMRKNNDRNNNSNDNNNDNNNSNSYGASLGAYSYFKMYETGPAVGSEQARYFNRGAVRDEKVFVPPNATIEMYERREQEMERNGVRNADFNSYAKTVESIRTTNLVDDGSARKRDERRVNSKRDESKPPRAQTGQFEGDRGNEDEELSSDENEDETKMVSNEFASTDKKSQSRRNQTSDRPGVAPQALPVRQHRLSSPSTEHYGGSVHARRPPDVSSDGKLRDASLEAATAASLGMPPSAQFLRMGMDGSGLGAPYFSQFLAAPQGRGDAPLLLLDPYGAMYRPHIMEATPQGMFPQGAFAADPVTGSIMMVPEAYIPMMAESQFLLDPRFSGAWGLPGALDESQLQQLYQMMQPFQHHQHKQQQQQQISERSKQEFFGQQSGSFPWSGYPFFFGKQFESQRKDESNEGKSFDQKQKKREERPEHFDKKVKEATSKPNTETTASQDKTMRMLVPRDGDLGQQQEVSDGGEQKSLGSNWLKETHQKLSEKGSAIQAQLDAQGKIAKQLKDYLLRDPLSQFSFPGSQNVFMKDTPPVTLNGSVTTTSVRTPEVGRQSASPKTVSAAVTLSGLERARDGELQWTERPSSPAKTDARVVSDGSTDVDRVRSPRLPPGVKTEEAFEKQPTVKEIAETPQRLEAQPNLAGERSVTRETRQFSPRPDPRHYHEGLLAFGQIASERTVKEKAERELVRRSIESPFCAFERVPPISYGDVSGRAPIQTTVPDSKSRVTDRELALQINLHGAIARPEFDRTEVRTTSLSNKTPKTERAGLQKEIIEPWEDSRESFQLVISSEKQCSPGQFDSDSDFEDDFTTKRELQTIASSFVPVRPDLENKENDEIFSLRPLKSEAERKQIRDNIDRLRSMAKRRNSKDRFMVFSRRKDLRSPTTILNSVTSAISELAGVESVEKEMRMKLAELQKKYREKARELARLQPKCRDGNEDGNGKSTPVKRGPGRPRKRKYFGATSKSGKPSPLRSSSPHTPSGAQSPDANCVPSEPETVLSKESEPPKKKKKAKQKSYGEDEMRSKTPPSRGFSPVEFSDFQVPAGKKKKPSKLSTSEDGGAAVQSRSKQPSGMKKDASSLGKRRKAASPTEINETSTNELESNAEPAAPADANKTAKAKKPRPKKRARPKLTIETAESVEEKADDEIPTDSASTTCDTPRAPSPVKSKKTKVTNKRRKPKVATPTKGKFEFPDVTALEDSFSENSVSPNDIAKEVVAIATRKQQEAQENNRESSSDNDDEVFTSSHDGRDGLSLLATFATAKKPSSTKRKRAGTATTSEDLSPKKRGRPKKPMDSTSFDLDVPVTPKKKKKKKVLEQDQTEEPKKKKKKKKNIHRVENSEEKPVEHREEKKPETTVVEKESEYPEDSPESPPESPTVNREDSEQEGDVYQPIMDLNKDSRRHRSDISTPREPEDSKMNLSSLFCDEWQPRRSERIFINSSVTTNSSTSPLSPTGKGHEFPWSKKSKKGPGMKSKSSKSLSQGEEELGESDVTTPPKLKGKATKKKALVKGKKRSPSNAASCDDYEQLRVSKRARSRSRLTNDFDEGEEEVDEVQEDDDELADEGEVEEEVSSVSEKRETQEERMTEQALLEVNGANQSVEERAKESENQQEDFDMHIELDEGASQKNDKRQASSVGAANVDKLDSSESFDRPQEANGNPEGSKEDEEMESHIELHNSPSLEDTRFTFVVDELVEGTKLLLPVDSVFFRGHISTFNEPDLFGVVLDGERGRRPHWRSTEQMLSQAIKDIQPPSVQFLPIGTRVCAHWSPQYRCFYPGSVTEAPPDEKEEEEKVWIEFDDGDSGLFQLNEIKRIHPNFPVEEVEATPSLPDKRPRTNSLSSSPAVFNKDLGSKMRSEEIASGFSSGNESSGEMHATRRRLRGKKKNKDDTWVATKRMGNNSEDRGASVRYTHSSTVKDERISREGTEPLKRKDNKNLSGNNATSQASLVSLDSRQTGNKIRGKTEASSGGKESSRSLEQAKLDMASVTSAELKQSEDEIHSHSSDVSQKRDVCESHAKGSTEKIRAVTDAGTESSDQGEDSEAASDVDSSKRDKGPCARGLLRTSDKDLSKRSLTLSLNSSFRSSRPSGDSPTRDNVSTSQDEDDSESYSDAFDESPLVEMKAFQPRLGRRRRSELDRLQADMKSSGPLWLWSGKNFQNKRKGKGKKIFYKAIVRGDETICVGDCAVFMSNPTKNLNLPYVGRIESMWEGFSGNMVVRVKWFYHPEETKPGRRPSDGRHSLYRSTHVDENDVQTIAHKCEVLTPAEFKRRLQNQDSPGTRASLSDRVFCCIGSYDPNNETLQTEL